MNILDRLPLTAIHNMRAFERRTGTNMTRRTIEIGITLSRTDKQVRLSRRGITPGSGEAMQCARQAIAEGLGFVAHIIEEPDQTREHFELAWSWRLQNKARRARLHAFRRKEGWT
jgi:hypothetical protein